MADLPSFDRLFRLARNEILSRQPALSLDIVERPGSDANILVAAATAVADEVIGQLGNIAQGLYISSAEREQLDTLLGDRYGLGRKVAGSAVGTVQFTTTAPASAFVIPKNTELISTTGVRFQTVQAVTFPAGTGPVSVQVRSTLSGADQQCKAGTITTIGAPIPSQPNDLAVTNVLATAGATDVESDESYRERGRAFFTTASKGTLDAIRQGGLATPGVLFATAFESVNDQGLPAPQVQLVVTDQFTESLLSLSTGPLPSSYVTQSNQLAQLVYQTLQAYRAGGIYVNVVVGKVVVQAVTLSLSFYAGVDIDAVTTQARAACVNYINNLSPGQTLDPAALGQLITNIRGLTPASVVVTPNGPVVPKPVQVLRTSLPLVNAVNGLLGFPIGQTPDDVPTC